MQRLFFLKYAIITFDYYSLFYGDCKTEPCYAPVSLERNKQFQLICHWK